MVYVCGSCRFMFERKGDVTECPACGGSNLHPADEKEEQEYREKESHKPDAPKQ